MLNHRIPPAKGVRHGKIARRPTATRRKGNFVMAVSKFTIGIEEEYQIIHPGTRELTSYIQVFLDLAYAAR